MVRYISIHSIADIITNSSSVEYILASEDSIQMFKKFMQDVLLAAGVTTPVDDLFVFSLVPDPGWLEYAMDDLDWNIPYNERSIDKITPEMYEAVSDVYDSYEDYIRYLNEAEDGHGIVHKAIKIMTKEGVDITDKIQYAFEVISVRE